MANEQNLIPFKKGEDKRRNIKGRPRKFILELKDQGYKLSEVTDTIEVLISRTEDELKDIYANTNSTVLEKVVSSAILKSIKRGDMASIETLLNRAYGKAKEKVEQEITINSHNIKLKFGNNDGEENTN
jgi:FAD synthase